MELEHALARGLPWALITVFAGGVLTSLTPCVYPMIPITIGIFGGKQATRLGAFTLATSYVLGMATMYTGMGVLAALLGFISGSLLANPWVIVPMVALFVALALSLLGFWEIRLPDSLQSRLSTIGGRGLGGAFAMGMVGGIIAAPCTGPVLAAILLLVASSGNLLLGASLLFTYALGIGVLFWLLAVFAVSLPKSGAWMDTVKSALGIAMLAAALFFLSRVVPALGRWGTSSRALLWVNLGLLAAGIVVGGVHLALHGVGALVRARKLCGVVFCSAALLGIVNYSLTPARKLAWIHSEPEALRLARERHLPVLVDFAAAWCVPCREFEVKTLADPRVAEELQRFVAAKVDVTDDTDANEALKKKYGADTLPAVILLDSSGKQVHAVREIIGPDEFLPMLRRVH